MNSSLTEAAGSGDLEGMKFLLARGANVNGHEHEDMPPLHAALRLNQDQAALLLIEYGAAVDRMDEGGMSALDRAVGAEIIQNLTLAGAPRRKT